MENQRTQMKLILESPVYLSGEVKETINESTGVADIGYYVSGIFSTPEKKNRNGRVYPKKIWQRAVESFNKKLQEKSFDTLGEYQHPPRSSVDLMEAVISIKELKIDENGNVIGTAKILDDGTMKTQKLKALIKEGYKIPVSSRGLGKVNESGVVEDFELITYDVVDTPSDYNAYLDGKIANEGYTFENGILQDKEFEITCEGNIVECSLSKNKEKYKKMVSEGKSENVIEELVEKAISKTTSKEELKESLLKILKSDIFGKSSEIPVEIPSEKIVEKSFKEETKEIIIESKLEKQIKNILKEL